MCDYPSSCIFFLSFISFVYKCWARARAFASINVLITVHYYYEDMARPVLANTIECATLFLLSIVSFSDVIKFYVILRKTFSKPQWACGRRIWILLDDQSVRSFRWRSSNRIVIISALRNCDSFSISCNFYIDTMWDVATVLVYCLQLIIMKI